MKTKLLTLGFLVGLPVWAQTNSAVGTNSIIWAVPQVVRDINQIKIKQYTTFDPNYAADKTNFLARFRPAAKQIFAEEDSGKDVRCANQIYTELLWLISSSADFKRMDERLDDMELLLASPPTNAVSNSNSAPECVSEWWERLEWAYQHVQKNEPIPPDILDRFNSPEKLTAYLTPLSVSDISRTGRDNWLEFNMSLADLIRWVIRDRPDDFDPQLRKTLMDLVLGFQDPDTGYWGQRYVINGREQFVPDLSTTFHIVTYLNGKVPHLDRIVATTLATRDLNSPVGWLWKGQVYNHNNVDVIYLFRFGWPVANAEQKKAIAAGIQSMLDRCLNESLRPDGSFKHLEADYSIEEATYFGVIFLYNAGYFDKSKRFWTDRDFPQAEDVRQRIIAFIEKHQKSGAAGGGDYNEILEDLKNDNFPPAFAPK
ncbi:MAG TPA: hypothetical protein VMD27_13110 [Candidatus Aquilonibacter sp.]|nr:hypothetical protein [Candidatus Aquilonibacter sp.]